MDPASETPAGVAFGRFRVLPHRRELLADGQPLKLGGRAYDVLMALIEARGAVVSKDALMARVWPDRVVEENCAPSADFGAARGLRAGARADPDGLRTRLPVHRRDPRSVRRARTSVPARPQPRSSPDRPCRRPTCRSRSPS